MVGRLTHAAGRAAWPILRQLRYGGRGRQCPCCGGKFRRFRDQHGRGWSKPESVCPGCGSRSRQRALVLFLQDTPEPGNRPLGVLHFAPEPEVARHLRDRPGISYLSADLDPSRAMVEADMTALPFEDGAFDLVIVGHVLEHIPDDARALRELFRVTRPGGRAVLQHPIEYAFPTYEDWTITAPEVRADAFGQHDHVRVYGRDFPERVRAAGFDVERVRYEELVLPETVECHGLRDAQGTLKADDIYVCTKA